MLFLYSIYADQIFMENISKSLDSFSFCPQSKDTQMLIISSVIVNANFHYCYFEIGQCVELVLAPHNQLMIHCDELVASSSEMSRLLLSVTLQYFRHYSHIMVRLICMAISVTFEMSLGNHSIFCFTFLSLFNFLSSCCE